MSDYINRESVLNTIEDMDKVLDTDRTVEEYKALLIECIKALPSRDSITELKEIRSEINQIDTHQFRRTEVLKILDKRISELKGE